MATMIKPYQHNPRRISENRAAKLAADLATFGDLGGIVQEMTTHLGMRNC